MKHSKLFVIPVGVLAPLTLAASISFATPPSDATPTPHVIGAALLDEMNLDADRIKFQTKDPADISVVTLRIEPGGTTGWHSHPGIALIAVAEGAGKLYAADCTSETFEEGQAFVESGDDPPTVFRNESAEAVVLTVTFVSPRGASFHRDEANPGCGVS